MANIFSRSCSVILCITIFSCISATQFPQKIYVDKVGVLTLSHTGQGEFRVTNDQNDFIGVLNYTPKDKQIVYVDWLNVAPEFRQRGIATLLMKTFAQEMKAQGYAKITLTAGLANRAESGQSYAKQLTKIINFYKKFGCVVTRHHYTLWTLYEKPTADMECPLLPLQEMSSLSTSNAEKVYTDLFNLYRCAVPGYFDINQ